MTNRVSREKINWGNTIYLIISPIISALAVSYWFYKGWFNWETVVLFLVLTSLIEISITAGYHRLFSHRTYKANPIVSIFFLFFGAGALQSSALLWSLDHRVHHQFVDHKDKDPYSISRGFMWAHITWLFYKFDDQVKDIKPADLYQDKLVVFQDKYWGYIAVLSGFILPTLIAHFAWGDAFGGFFVAGVFRSVVNHHATFLINSVSHCIGKQTYSDTHSARDNWFTALLTFGEGYHNFHHEFPSDYRNGVRYYQYDPSKWLIYGLSLIGWTYDLKRVSHNLIERKRLAMTKKRAAQQLQLATESKIPQLQPAC